MDLPFLELGQVGMRPSVRAERVPLCVEIPQSLGVVVDTAVVVALICQTWSPGMKQRYGEGRTYVEEEGALGADAVEGICDVAFTVVRSI